MTEQKQNVFIGLFVLCGLAALAVLIIRFGEASWLFSRGYTVTARFKTVTGLRQGTTVELSGVAVGRVVELKLQDPQDPSQGVEARMEIDRHYLIPSGSEAVVIPPLMGQPSINILPPAVRTDPLPMDNQAVINGKMKNAMESILEPKFMASLEKTTIQIGELASALKPAAAAIKDILEQRTIQEVESPDAKIKNLTANMYTAVERLHSVLKHIDTVLGDPAVQSNFKQTLENFRAASDEAKVAVAGFREFSQSAVVIGRNVQQLTVKVDNTLDMTHQRIDELGKGLVTNSEKLSTLLDHMNSVGNDLSQGKGTVGMLLRDPKFHDELMLTVQRLGTAASELTVLVKQWQQKGILGM